MAPFSEKVQRKIDHAESVLIKALERLHTDALKKKAEMQRLEDYK